MEYKLLKMMKRKTRTDLNVNRDSKRATLSVILAAILIGIAMPLANADTADQIFTLTSTTSSNAFLENTLNQTGEFTYNISALSTQTPRFNFASTEDYKMPVRFMPPSADDIFRIAPQLVGPPTPITADHNDMQFGYSYDPLIDSMFLNQADRNFGAPAKRQSGLFNIKF